MRPLVGLVLVVMVVVAGCSAPIQPDPEGLFGGADDGADATPTPRPDPPTDRLGWENGYWYDDPVDIDAADGLSERERSAITARAMARVEEVRRLEFKRSVPVRVVDQDTYTAEFLTPNETSGEALQRFDNAKFEALFLVGETNDSVDRQRTNLGTTVRGFYSQREESIVVVGPDDTAQLAELTLAHELVHALQDQHFRLGEYPRTTRDRFNALNGLLEGDANLVAQLYRDRCGTDWDCVRPPSADGGASGGDIHSGIYFLNYFPYSEGPSFVAHHRSRGGWEAVNALYDEPPTSATQIIDPAAREAAPTNVTVRDQPTAGWSRVRPPNRTDYATLGQSALSAAFAYTIVAGPNESVVSRTAFVNYGPDGRVNRSDPFDYDLGYTTGLVGDRLHVYERSDDVGYVWKLVWSSPGEAEEFANGYRQLLSHWGGTPAEGRDGVWRIEDGPFADAFRLRMEGDTVVVTNAPTVADLDGVRAS